MSIQFQSLFQSRLTEHTAMVEQLTGLAPLVEQIGTALVDAILAGNKIFLFGNGGSAADAQHLAAELLGRYYHERRALPAMALTVNSSALTAIGNDYAFNQVFVRQLEAFARRGDVAVGISTSGHSANVRAALRFARRQGLVTVLLTGQGGTSARDEVDFLLAVPASDTPRIQEGHTLVGHILCEIVEAAVSNGPAPV